MSNLEKAKWLQINYGNYPLKWYLEDKKRLDAIYQKAYRLYLRNIQDRVNETRQAELDKVGERMRQAYAEVYHANYDEDFSANRLETHHRVQAIRHLWNVSVVA
ncbi:hypothetical protein GPZ88_10185 (plasmid) [Streptococcus ruminicola]|uniref:Uncharacterized protein n=1 Tax=Streptococcus ruminicola TaxID=2686210 RepID=A0A6G8I2N7_9STRE|nr:MULTISPECIES: hypothetical protein [Streptococcus]QGX47386.1 hypothetical protein GPA00_09640 [Streptococcus equinus]QIM47434.1 hypothetical protein GPZ88_10185 [Streptococcus ruminicola]